MLVWVGSKTLQGNTRTEPESLFLHYHLRNALQRSFKMLITYRQVGKKKEIKLRTNIAYPRQLSTIELQDVKIKQKKPTKKNKKTTTITNNKTQRKITWAGRNTAVPRFSFALAEVWGQSQEEKKVSFWKMKYILLGQMQMFISPSHFWTRAHTPFSIIPQLNLEIAKQENKLGCNFTLHKCLWSSDTKEKLVYSLQKLRQLITLKQWTVGRLTARAEPLHKWLPESSCFGLQEWSKKGVVTTKKQVGNGLFFSSLFYWKPHWVRHRFWELHLEISSYSKHVKHFLRQSETTYIFSCHLYTKTQTIKTNILHN